MIATRDGSWMVAGYGGSASYLDTSKDMYVVKFNANGKSQWAGRYGNIGTYDEASSVIETKDKGYLISGFTADVAGKKSGALVKINSTGEMEWSKTFSTDYSLSIASAAQTLDNKYIVGGTITIDDVPHPLIIVMQTDGTVLKYQKLTPLKTAAMRKIITAENGDVVILMDAGTDHVNKKLIVIRAGSNAEIKWINSFSGIHSDFCNDIIETKDQGFAITGGNNFVDNSGSVRYMFTAAKLNSKGKVEWYRSNSSDDRQQSITMSGYTIAEQPDGNFISCGSILRNGTRNIYVVKHTPAGHVIFTGYMNLSSSSYDWDDFGRGIVLQKNGYVLASTSQSFGYSGVLVRGDSTFSFCKPLDTIISFKEDTNIVYNDIALSFVKQTGIKESGNLVSFATSALVQNECSEEISNTSVSNEKNKSVLNNMNLYPNPADAYTNISFNCEKAGAGMLQVYDAMGNTYYSKKVNMNKGTNSYNINLSRFHSGEYRIVLNVYDKVFTLPFYKK